ncbi:MAG TPA: 2-oxo acid dehydrogenase subunit E2 [Solirubrobacterales bacterium]|nr:2-oxo acid dehydrogenase subunit E2 [Solirubrobacterales bacterium]
MADNDPDERPESRQGGTAKGETTRTELGRRAQSAARRLAESKATIPHGYAGRRIGLTGEGGARAQVIRAFAVALRAREELNCAYRDGGIERHSRVNVAITVETNDGPLMPTLFDADEMGVDAIADRIDELTARAERGELTPPELSGATVTVGSAGEGADAFAGAITPGQALHLGIGRRQSSDAPALHVTLSFDQRAIRPSDAGALLGLLAEASASSGADD